MIRRLSNEVFAMGKRRQVLWETVTCSDDGLEHQVLALELQRLRRWRAEVSGLTSLTFAEDRRLFGVVRNRCT